MKDKHQSLIDSLSYDIQSGSKKLIPANRLALLSLLIYIPLVAGLMWWVAPFRESFSTQLFNSPRFSIETLLGLISCALLAHCAIKSSIPGGLSKVMLWLTLAVTASWIGHIGFGLIAPTLEPSMAGKRNQCYLEVLYYSIPGSIAMLLLLLRRYSMAPLLSGFCAGAAAGLMAALMMQLACMYDAYHGLIHHVLPALVVAAISSLATYYMVRLHNRKKRRTQAVFLYNREP